MSELIHINNQSELVNFDSYKRELEVVKHQIAKDCSDSELHMFCKVAIRTGLDPWSKQIYAIKRGGKMSIQTGIDGFRLMAQRSGEYQGQLGPYWCGPDGDWKEVWLERTNPAAAKVGVLRKGFSEPLWAVARWDSYAQQGSSTWKSLPDVMLAKCAESLALRKAFPAEISGVYTREEMQQADAEEAEFVSVSVSEERQNPAPPKPAMYRDLPKERQDKARSKFFAIAEDIGESSGVEDTDLAYRLAGDKLAYDSQKKRGSLSLSTVQQVADAINELSEQLKRQPVITYQPETKAATMMMVGATGGTETVS